MGKALRTQLARLGSRRSLRCDRPSTDWCRESISAPCYVQYIACVVLAVCQGLSQGGDVNPEVRLFDREAPPDELCQLVTRQDLAGSLGQRDEDIKRTAANCNLFAVLSQQTFGGD